MGLTVSRKTAKNLVFRGKMDVTKTRNGEWGMGNGE